MTPDTGEIVVIGMTVSATTGIGRGATIAVIAGKVGAATTGTAAATAVAIMTTMTDRDCTGAAGPQAFDHGALWRPVVLSGVWNAQRSLRSASGCSPSQVGLKWAAIAAAGMLVTSGQCQRG